MKEGARGGGAKATGRKHLRWGKKRKEALLKKEEKKPRWVPETKGESREGNSRTGEGHRGEKHN